MTRRQILKFNEPTINGRIYTREHTELTSVFGFVKSGESAIVGGYLNATIEDDGIWAEVYLSPEFQCFDIDKLRFYSCGLGVLSGNVVTQATITHFGVE